MTVAILADTHLPRGGAQLPDACVAHLRAAALILHAGDLVAATALDELEAIGPPVVVVHGNVDRPDVVGRLPAERAVEVGKAQVAMVHDAGPARGRLQRVRRRFPEADAVVFGHSHIPLHEEADGFQIFNPGSPTVRRRQPVKTMGLAHWEDGRLVFEHVELGP